ncbi:hypothetical protein D3C79_1043370 [compost metagenome]
MEPPLAPSAASLLLPVSLLSLSWPLPGLLTLLSSPAVLPPDWSVCGRLSVLVSVAAKLMPVRLVKASARHRDSGRMRIMGMLLCG